MSEEYEETSVNEQVAEAHTGVMDDTADHQEDPTSQKEYNFRRLEDDRNRERESRLQLERSYSELKSKFEQIQEAQKPKREADDLLNYGDYQSDISEREKKLAERLIKIEAKTTYPDLDEVILKYGKQLSPAVKKACFNYENPYIAVYEACVDSKGYYQDQMKDVEHKYAKKAEVNAKKPNNPDKIGGKGMLSMAKDISKMSDAELLNMADNYRRG